MELGLLKKYSTDRLRDHPSFAVIAPVYNALMLLAVPVRRAFDKQ